jgi:hypothetical protein
MTIDAKTEQMISLVLQINGHARPEDLHTLPPDERVAALRAYYQGREGSDVMHWRGEQLWMGTRPPDASFFAETPSPGLSGGLEPHATGPLSTAPVAAAVPSYGPAPVAPVADFEAASFGDLVAPAASVATSVATLDEAAAPSPFGAGSASPLPGLVAVDTAEAAGPLVSETSVFTPPVDSRLEPDFLPEPVATPSFSLPAETPVSVWWWLLAILWAPWGGLVAYLVTKGTNPVGAARVLKVSLIVWGVSILLGIALGVMAFMAV